MDWIDIDHQEPRLHDFITVPTEAGGQATCRYLGNRRIGPPGEAIDRFDFENYVVTRWRPA